MIERSAGTPTGRIKASEAYAGSDPQVVAGSEYNQMLQDRRDRQAAQRIPRSQQSWESEEQRLGSWNSGVGRLSPPGVGNVIPIGRGREMFNLSEEKGK